MRQSLEASPRLFGAGKMALAFALLLGASQFAASVPARADDFRDAGDHGDVYQVIRGDLVCNSREACGGAAAIPMNRPGWFFLPGGMGLAQHPAVPPVAYPVPAHLKHHKM
ncbi:hypothetical protein SAMN05519104_8129 [Rhizobiales bacterium GAS188]|nr:hypothetical protein SAMN05519104_4383 [Rhizobiales bacterium GAS188]SEF05944.1 hypothetical protein SAMN05519104_8129 [Rhizobiales bacterium GAS188]